MARRLLDAAVLMGTSGAREIEIAREDRLLFLAPHPDDEALAGAALLGRAVRVGARVEVLFLTSGEANPWAQRAAERRWRIDPEDRMRWAARRECEARAALKSLGVEVERVSFLRLPDQGLTRLLLSSASLLVKGIRRAISAVAPTILVGPSPRDRHPDHSAAGIAIRIALADARLRRQPLGLDYVVHGPPLLSTTSERYAISLDRDERERKTRAISCHGSQLVLRRSFCLGFVGEREGFLASSAAEAPRHLVCDSTFDATSCRFEIVPISSLGRLNRRSLHLLVVEGAEVRHGLTMRLPARSGPIDVCHFDSRRSVAKAWFETSLHQATVILPRSLLPSSGTAFVKLAQRFGFFDPDGWLEIETGAPPWRERASGGSTAPEEESVLLSNPEERAAAGTELRPSGAGGSNPFAAAERGVVAAALAVTFALKIVYLLHYRFSSDEPQHLHVAWGWAHGLVQYRDLFDNHAPLFHLLYAPLVAWIGENPEILLWMRAAVLPLYVLIAWSTYRIGRLLFSQRVGAWAAVATGLLPPFFLLSVEFRADALWAALWLGSLQVLVEGALTPGRAFIAGVLFGATLATSLKTLPLLAGLLIAAVSAASARGEGTGRGWVPAACWTAAGAGVLPGCVALLFYHFDAGAALADCVVFHNLSAMSLGQKSWPEVAVFAAALPLTVFATSRAGRGTTPSLGRRSRGVLIATFAYIALLVTVWPVVTRQDILPLVPLVAIYCAAVIEAARIELLRRRCLRTDPAILLAAACGAFVVWLFCTATPWHDETRFQHAFLADVLRLTRSNELVMDTKGEAVFRARPVYPVFENITLQRIRLGELADDVPERLSATATAVATTDSGRYPPRAREFLNRNYLRIGTLRVAGQFLSEPASDDSSRRVFEVTIPAAYALVSTTGRASGTLDGAPYRGPRSLAAGLHSFEPVGSSGRLALLWARAARLGYSPFGWDSPTPPPSRIGLAAASSLSRVLRSPR